MKRRVAVFALLLSSCVGAHPGPERQVPPIELAGRVPGVPQRCVTLDRIDGLRQSENNTHTLVHGGGRTIWANFLGQCGFGRDDILVIEPLGSQLCAGDIVRSIDRISHIPGPTCVLGDFIPYMR